MEFILNYFRLFGFRWFCFFYLSPYFCCIQEIRKRVLLIFSMTRPSRPSTTHNIAWSLRPRELIRGLGLRHNLCQSHFLQTTAKIAPVPNRRPCIDVMRDAWVFDSYDQQFLCYVRSWFGIFSQECSVWIFLDFCSWRLILRQCKDLGIFEIFTI